MNYRKKIYSFDSNLKNGVKFILWYTYTRARNLDKTSPERIVSTNDTSQSETRKKTTASREIT